LKRTISPATQYCPHQPSRKHEFNAELYRIGPQLSIHVRDIQSTLDGILACALLFLLLFVSSFASLPTAGLAGYYQSSLLRTVLVTALALVVMFVYGRVARKKTLRSRLGNAKESLGASLLVLLIWGTLWALFGELSRTYHLAMEPTRLNLAPLSLCLGVLDGLIVYAYCAERFVTGIGRTMGILISSVLAWLLFVVASLDSALYLLPIAVVLAYVGAKTASALGPTVVMSLLLTFFYVYSGASPWMLGIPEAGYWIMTAVSFVSAFVAGLSLGKVPLGGISRAGNSAI
jgi:hypothetical protein